VKQKKCSNNTQINDARYFSSQENGVHKTHISCFGRVGGDCVESHVGHLPFLFFFEKNEKQQEL
jgi:hypothetical protein